MGMCSLRAVKNSRTEAPASVAAFTYQDFFQEFESIFSRTNYLCIPSRIPWMYQTFVMRVEATLRMEEEQKPWQAREPRDLGVAGSFYFPRGASITSSIDRIFEHLGMICPFLRFTASYTNSTRRLCGPKRAVVSCR